MEETETEETRGVGRPAWEPTEEDLEKIRSLSGMACTIEEICAALGIGKTTLYKNEKLNAEFADAIKLGREKGKVFVKGQLAGLIKDRHPASIMFYLKTQCGWKEKVEVEGSINLIPVIAPQLAASDEWNKLAQNPDKVTLGTHSPDPKPS